MKPLKLIFLLLLLCSTASAQSIICDSSGQKCYHITVHADGTVTVQPASVTPQPSPTPTPSSSPTPNPTAGLVFDSFQRANMEGLGASDSGHVWTTERGSWAIRDGQAACLEPDMSFGGVALAPPTAADAAVEVQLSLAAGLNTSGLILRYSDERNFLWLRGNSQNVQLYRVTNGAYTQLRSVPRGVLSGDVLRAEMKGAAIEVFLGTESLFTVSSEFNRTANVHGLYSDTTWLRFKNFKVDPAAVANKVAVSFPSSYQPFQRGANNRADLLIEGEGQGRIEARCNDGAWVRIAEATGAFSAVLPGQSTGDCRLQVRAGSAVATVRFVKVGDIFIPAGQSNVEGRGEKLNSFPEAVVFDQNGIWRPLEDPTDPLSGGSLWPLIAAKISPAAGVPLAFITTGQGGRGLVAEGAPWRPGNLAFNECVRVVRASRVNGARALLWYDGESDALAVIPENDYQAALKEWRSGLSAALGFGELDALMFQIGVIRGWGETRASVDNIRMAQAAVVAEDPYFFGPVPLYDLPLDDGVHMVRASDLERASERAANFLLAKYYGGVIQRGARATSARVVSASEVEVSFDVPNGQLMNAQAAGWRVNNALVSSAIKVAPDRVRLSLSSPVASGQTISFGSYNDAAGVVFNDSKGMPVEPFVGTLN